MSNTTITLQDIPDSTCACESCQDMCKSPCWPTPEEADKLMDMDYAGKMMLDHWWTDKGDIYVVCPAIKGREGDFAPSWPNNTCTLFKNGLCGIQSVKPIEGRKAKCSENNSGLRELVAMTWDNEKGRQVVQKWKKINGWS